MSGIRPSRAWYWLALGVAVLGIGGAILFGARAVSGFTAPVRIDPGGDTVTLKKDGLTIYSTAPAAELACQASGPTGASIALVRVTRTEKLTVNSTTWYAALRSDRDIRPGLFDVKCEQPAGDVRIAAAPRVSLASLVSAVVGAIGAATGAVIVAAAVILITYVRRRSSRRRATA
jgi:hypothetical protein